MMKARFFSHLMRSGAACNAQTLRELKRLGDVTAQSKSRDVARFCTRVEHRSSDNARAKQDTNTTDRALRRNVVIVGGRGYVGSHIVQAAESLQHKGVFGDIIVVSRSASPAMDYAGVKHVQGDALHPGTWAEALQQASAVITAVGSFGSNATMRMTCGTTNIRLAQAARDAEVQRFVLISSRMYAAQPPFLRGYFEGKRAAEQAAMEHFGDQATIMRPAFVYGSRVVRVPGSNASVTVPLGLLGAVLSKVSSTSIAKSLSKTPVLDFALAPPVSAENLGRCCIAAALDMLPESAPEPSALRARVLESEEIEHIGSLLP